MDTETSGSISIMATQKNEKKNKIRKTLENYE